MDEIADVTITADSTEWLRAFTEKLVADRLIACGNIAAANVQSIYRWKGEVETADEVAVVLHTRRALVEQVIARAVAEHPYDTPQVLAVPVIAANPAYQQWVIDSTVEPDELTPGS